MSAVIDCGDGRYIAGDPVTDLEPGRHWCDYCSGSGLEYDLDGRIEICCSCDGSGDQPCRGEGCPACADERHATTRIRSKRLLALVGLILAAADRANDRRDYDEAFRLLRRHGAVSAAHDQLDWS